MELEPLLDVMREHGWSETGQYHDPVYWLKLKLGEPDARVDELECEVDRLTDRQMEAEGRADELEREVNALQKRLIDSQPAAGAVQ